MTNTQSAANKHFSPVSQKWVTCEASSRTCRFAHKTTQEVTGFKQEQIQTSESLTPEENYYEFHDLAHHHNGNKADEAFADYSNYKKIFNSTLDAVIQDKLEVSNDFYKQMDEINDSATGKMQLGELPTIEDIQPEVKNASSAARSAVGKAGYDMYAAEKKYRDLIKSGIEAT